MGYRRRFKGMWHINIDSDSKTLLELPDAILNQWVKSTMHECSTKIDKKYYSENEVMGIYLYHG
jgi:hypothetical protein